MPLSEHVRVAHVEYDGIRAIGVRGRRLRSDERAAIQLDDCFHVRRPRRLRACRPRHEVLVAVDERVIEAALEADRGRRLRAHRGAAERTGDVPGVYLDAVAELDEPVQRVEQPFGSFDGLDGEVRACCVTDQERVAREHEPRLVAARAVDDRERAVLRAVAGCVDRADDHPAELELGPVGERLVPERRARGAVDADREAVLESEATVTRDVIGMGVRLEHAHEGDLVPSRGLEIRLDRIGWIDDDCRSRLLVADQVRSAPEVVVDELPEQHRGDGSSDRGYIF